MHARSEAEELPPRSTPDFHLSKVAIVVMATACATSVANIYYNQPLLRDFAGYFGESITRAGMVATAAQVGYGAGILVFVPLGDTHERKRIILWLIYSCMALSALAALAPTLSLLVFLQFLVGATAVSTQVLIPLAVDFSTPSERGRIVGSLMAGLLAGLLLARTVSGFIGDHLGWRAVFWIAAVLMLATGLMLQGLLPSCPPAQRVPYSRLLRSLGELVLTQPVLRRASLVSASSFAGFSAFWAVLSFLMLDRFHRGATETGLFGLIGLAGALCAPSAGRLADRIGSGRTLLITLLLSVLAFFTMWVWLTIPGLIVGVLLLDLGVQSTQVAAQSEAISLIPEARNRLNTVYMVSRFGGGALGSAVGAYTYARWGWPGACLACIGLSGIALMAQLRSLGAVRAASPEFES